MSDHTTEVASAVATKASSIATYGGAGSAVFFGLSANEFGALCGVIIGFVGLVAPHMVRLLSGPDHRWVLPGSALLGASLVLLADALARTVAAPAELPLGVLTALVGVPFFLLLLRGRAGRGL